MISGVADGVRKRAIRAFISEMQNHESFAYKRVIKTWRTWDGSKGNDKITTDMMPAAQVRMIGGPVQRVASTRKPGGAATWTLETKPTIVIELWSNTTDQGDIFNLADMIYEVFGVQDDAARKALQARLGSVGIRDWQLTSEVAPPSLDAYNIDSIYAVGTYQITMLIEG